MTVDEAVICLSDMKIRIAIPKAAVQARLNNEALNMAIEALKCSEFPNNSDTISRQAALETIRTMQTYKLFAGDDMLLIDQAEAQTELMMLPPAEPKTGHWIPVTNGRGGHQCDRCGSYAPSYQSGTEWLSNFCPECNADMRGEAE